MGILCEVDETWEMDGVVEVGKIGMDRNVSGGEMEGSLLMGLRECDLKRTYNEKE